LNCNQKVNNKQIKMINNFKKIADIVIYKAVFYIRPKINLLHQYIYNIKFHRKVIICITRILSLKLNFTNGYQ